MLGFLIIAGTLFLPLVAGLWIRRRFVALERSSGYLEHAMAIFGAMAVVYSVLLAFVALGVWEDFDRAKSVAETESACLLGVAELTAQYQSQSPEARKLGRAVLDYASTVVEKEYPAMAQMQVSEEAALAYTRMWEASSALRPSTAQESNLQNAIFHLLGETGKHRVARLIAARTGLPAVLWVTIGFGGFILLSFSLLFASSTLRAQFLLNGAMALLIGLVLFAVVELNYPFLGSVSVAPEGLEYVRTYLGRFNQ
jgi:hypothetical protein